tara:strand:+ start:6164 stop:6940 length:777 start_codon:yes stop_codon:yes gene_type:complete
MIKLKVWKFGINPDKFIADCVDLTDDEIGKYFRFLCHAWKHEAHLLDDIKRINNISKNPNMETTKYILDRFFKKDKKGYFCPAQLEEWDWVQEKSSKATESVNKRWEYDRITNNSNNNSNNNKIIKDTFEKIWSQLKVKRGSKLEGLKAYTKLYKTKDMPETNFIIEKFNAKCDSVTENIYIPHFSKWLNQGMWTEELITENKTNNDNFGIAIRDPYRNLTFWKKGRRMPQDFDGDIIKKYKEGEISEEAFKKLNISV